MVRGCGWIGELVCGLEGSPGIGRDVAAAPVVPLLPVACLVRSVQLLAGSVQFPLPLELLVDFDYHRPPRRTWSGIVERPLGCLELLVCGGGGGGDCV